MRKLIIFVFLILGVGLTSCAKAKTNEQAEQDKITFLDAIIELEVGESKKINYKVTHDKAVEFDLSDDSIAIIEGASIKGIAEGEVILTATIKGSNVTTTINVKVTKPVDEIIEVTGITIEGEKTGYVGGEIMLIATIEPANATDKTVTWSSSDETLATVVDGLVTLHSKGVVTITASAGKKRATHIITAKLNTKPFYYEMELNGGNLDYPTRRALVDEFINDYNTVTNKNYTLETLGMHIGSDVDYYKVFYHADYRDKWLWLADYLGEVGSATNKQSAKDILTYDTPEAWNGVSLNWKYALSYEVRAFLKGILWKDNANWPSSDYSDREIGNGFWPKYLEYNLKTPILSKGPTETLPPVVYKEGFEFVGWFKQADFSGEPLEEITIVVPKVYAKFVEKNPITKLTIENPMTELIKKETYQLDVAITPSDAFNKTLLYFTSDERVAKVSEKGLITALNAGNVTITISNYSGSIEVTLDLIIHPDNDINITFSEGYHGHIQVGDSFNMVVEGVGKLNMNKAYTYEVLDETILEFSGTNQFTALKVGETMIDIYDGATKVESYKVIVQNTFDDTNRVDQLLALLANANNPVAQGVNVILIHQPHSEYSQPKHESVNAYLFDDFKVNRTEYLADPTLKADGIRPSTEFILVHDTANINAGLINHGNFFKNPDVSVSMHYTTGDYGILQTLEDQYIARHTTDDGSQPFVWLPTGITANNMAMPEFDISEDGYFMINGQKTSVLAPKDGNKILDKTYFTYQGPTWDVFDGEYHLGTHWFTRTQQTYGVIGTRGAKNNSIGIEMNVNTNGDSIDTIQRTAKLVAHLLEANNLPNHRVITHNTVDGKGDAYMLCNTVYKGDWYFPRFMEYVAVEREVLKNFSDAIIQFSSDSPLVSKTGRVIKMPDKTTSVEYTITVTIGDVTKSITLISVVPGIHTWHQNRGNFTPTQRWAKAGYRVGV